MAEARYTPELAGEVLARMRNGTTLRQACRDLGVPESSVRYWVQTDREGFRQRYHEARAMMIDSWSDELLCVAYDRDIDPADKRVITENLRWLLSKTAPTRFGERLLVSGDEGSPIRHLHEDVGAIVRRLTPEQLDSLEAFTQSMLAAKAREES